MPPDAREREVAGWLERAHADLRAAEVDLAADPPLSADAAFHCQQAAEKALKAFLTRHDHPFPKAHDIGRLATASLEHDPSLEQLLRRSARLTVYAWRFRYAGDVLEPERSEVEDALDVARRVVRALEDAVAEGC